MATHRSRCVCVCVCVSVWEWGLLSGLNCGNSWRNRLSGFFVCAGLQKEASSGAVLALLIWRVTFLTDCRELKIRLSCSTADCGQRTTDNGLIRCNHANTQLMASRWKMATARAVKFKETATSANGRVCESGDELITECACCMLPTHNPPEKPENIYMTCAIRNADSEFRLFDIFLGWPCTSINYK